MGKRAVIAGILLAVVVILLVWWLWPSPYYSDDPKTWIDRKPGNVQEINVDKVTQGKGYLDPVGLQWNDGTVLTAFGYDGLYQGTVFQDAYVHPDSGKRIIAITSSPTPNDGVIEGFIIERLQDDVVRAFVFLDEDWKRALGHQTNIVWGADYQNLKSFVFTEISPGIYMDSIVDDPARFADNYQFHTGGIAVGTVRPEDIRNQRVDGVTVIRTY